MLLNVPDDYQIPITNPKVLWADIMEKFGDRIEVDLEELDYYLKHGFPLFDSNMIICMLTTCRGFTYLETMGRRLKPILIISLSMNSENTDHWRDILNPSNDLAYCILF